MSDEQLRERFQQLDIDGQRHLVYELLHNQIKAFHDCGVGPGIVATVLCTMFIEVASYCEGPDTTVQQLRNLADAVEVRLRAAGATEKGPPN